MVAALDVGGTRIKAAMVDRSLTVLARTTAPTPPNIGQDIGAAVRACVGHLMDELRGADQEVRLVGCGVVVPGLVDESTGTGSEAPGERGTSCSCRSAPASRAR